MTMLSDDDARTLLSEAAATVDVAAQAPDLLATAKRARSRKRLGALVVVVAVVAVVVAIVAGGIWIGPGRLQPTGRGAPAATTSSSPSDQRSTDPTPSDSARTEEPRTRMVTVPILAGYTQREAVQRVEERGLRSEVSIEPVTCIPEGEVAMSVPGAGTRLGVNSKVTVVVSGGGSAMMPSDTVCTQGVASQPDRRIAELLRKFAHKPRVSIAPFAPTVHLGLGEELHQVVPERELHNAVAWRICAPYAERSCPMSALTTLARMEDVTVNALREPPDLCFAGDPPAELAGQRVIRIEPQLPRDASCVSYASVDVYVSEVGQITSVVLRLGSP
jgi:hypothetical protein